MNKFDSVLNRVTENFPVQQTQNNSAPNPQLLQAAKLLNLDPKVLQQILAAQQTTQTGQASATNTQQNNNNAPRTF